MKIQLDTTSKTIKLEENVKIYSFMNFLKKLLPNNEWKEFTLETNTTISYWSNPVIIKEYPRPYTSPWITWTSNNVNNFRANYSVKSQFDQGYQLKAGTYNIEVSDKLL